MALNKRKVLDAARKYAQKGAKAKALKEYNKLLKADSSDAKLLLEVGDAYRRWGQAEEAIAQYGKVAQQYRQDGFDARAVAVFKQILSLDPKHYPAYVSLSELYQRMGLDSEAITALQTAADGYHSEGRKADALDLLRQTAALDPTNTTSRLKVAELLRQEGMNSEALSEYKAVATELEAQRDHDQLATVQERILEIKPDEIETLSALVRNLMSSGDLVRAEAFAVRALNVAAEPSQYELLIDLYAQNGDDAKLADATRGLAKLYRDRGDEEKARELMQRLPVEEDAGSSGRIEVDVSEIDEPDLGDDELLDEEPFLSISDDADSVGDLGSSGSSTTDDLDLDLESVAPAPKRVAKSAAKPEALPEGDPDQLLAEANVYLRYGKRDQAIASLRGVLAQEPNHRAALEKLGDAYSDDGQVVEAVEAWKKAAVQVREAGDGEALSVLKDRIAALDPVAAEQIGTIEPATPTAPAASADAVDSLDLDFDVDLDLDDAIDEVAASKSQASIDFDSGGDDFEIEIDDEPLEFEFETEPKSPAEPEPAPEPETAAADAPSETVDEEDDDELVFDVDVELDLDDDDDEEEASPSADASATDANEASPAKIAEELEEADFYIAQEMFDEAEAIVARILELVPDHSDAMARQTEIATARGAQPEESGTESLIDVEVEDSTVDPAVGDLEETERLGEVDAEPAAEFDVEVDVEIDVDTDEVSSEGEGLSLAADESDGVSASADVAEEMPAADETDVVVESETAQPVTATSEEEETSGDAAAGGEETFDLREALSDVLADDEELESGDDASASVLSTVEDGFGSIFSDFKKGVSAALEEGDYETRYDLGLAYREMGLYEDAIGEFRICLDSAPRRFDSLYLMGICARDLARFDESVNYFEQALSTEEIADERLVGVYFDLSFAQEGVGDIERAAASLQKVLEIDPSFPGVQERLAELEAGGATSPKLGKPGDVYESFDELFEDDDDDEGGDGEMVDAVPEETFESFGDVIEDAERAIDADENPADAESGTNLDSDPDPGADTQSGKKPGRKKISFV